MSNEPSLPQGAVVFVPLPHRHHVLALGSTPDLARCPPPWCECVFCFGVDGGSAGSGTPSGSVGQRSPLQSIGSPLQWAAWRVRGVTRKGSHGGSQIWDTYSASTYAFSNTPTPLPLTLTMPGSGENDNACVPVCQELPQTIPTSNIYSVNINLTPQEQDEINSASRWLRRVVHPFDSFEQILSVGLTSSAPLQASNQRHERSA